MKKRLLSCVLTLAVLIGLCVGMMGTASATDWTISNWEREGEPKTGLKMFTEEKMNPRRWSIDGKGAPDDFYGLKDAIGNVILPADYLRLEYLGPNRLLALKADGGLGVITPNGTIIYPFTASQIKVAEISGSDNSLLIIGEGVNESNSGLSKDTGLYDWNAQAIIPMGTYQSIWSIGGKYFILWDKNTNLRGVYEYGAGVVIPCKYKYVRNLGNDMFMVVNSDIKCAVVDKAGQQILPFEYEDILTFKQGCFILGKFYNSSEKELFVSDSIGGVGESDSTYDALIDGYGKYLIPFGEYDNIYIDNDGYVHGGHWTGKYQSSLSGSSGGEGKIYNYTYHIKLADLLTEKGGTALPSSTSSTDTTTPGAIITIPTTGTTSVSALFKDVRNSDYFADAVLWAVERNITSGTSTTTFSPGATCSKAQILTFLWRANGSPELTAANPFTDIKTTDYFYKAAVWAAEKGLVSGSTFGANTDCTRAMTVEYLWKAAGSPTPSSKASFTDVPTNAEYAQAVAWAVENEITSGTGGNNFSPNSTCTRGQIVTFLHRAMGK
ncbi:MAG: S-layer homology domain-containing protein [Dysosmobacter sp.]|nr:S-layer homology domain-containing protein [Dysosmobacter sp.]